MAVTTSQTAGFSAARYTQMIRKQVLDFGPFTHVFRQLADVGKLEPGHTNIYQVNRRKRIPIPMAGVAVEGSAPAATSLNIDNVQGTATQYVLVTQFTDVAEIYAFHDLLEDAVIEVKDAMARLDDKIMSDSYVAATNVIYPGSITTISNITAADILNTNMVRRGSSGLRTGDQIFGAAPRFAGNKLAGIIHEKAVMDIQQDATWDQYASRQRPELQEKGIINDWEGVLWYVTNFMPEYTNLGTTEGAVGCSTADAGGSGSGFNGTGQTYVVTRKHQWRGFEEGISGVLTAGTSPANGHNWQINVPNSGTGLYVYNVYIPSTNGGTTLRLAATNVAEGGAAIFTGPQTTGVTAPVAPAVGVTVLPCFILGKGAVSTVDLSALEVFITPRVATPSDPAVQNRYVSAKFFLGSFLQQNAWIRLLLSATSQ